MRALQCVLILVTTVILGSHRPLAAVVPVRDGSAASLASKLQVVADTAGAAATDHKSDPMVYAPREIGRDSEEASSVGTALIIALLVVVGVIIVFIIRHHRTGRAG